MVVVVGVKQEGDKEDFFLVPDQEGDHETRKTDKLSWSSGVNLTLIALIIIVITVSIKN